MDDPQDRRTCPASGGAAFWFRRWKSHVRVGGIIWRFLAALAVDRDPGEVLGRKFGNPTVSYCITNYVGLKVCVHKVGQRCASADFT
jgi:hypothetical protein